MPSSISQFSRSDSPDREFKSIITLLLEFNRMQVFLSMSFGILPAFFELTLNWVEPVDSDYAPVSGVAYNSQPAESESH